MRCVPRTVRTLSAIEGDHVARAQGKDEGCGEDASISRRRLLIRASAVVLIAAGLTGQSAIVGMAEQRDALERENKKKSGERGPYLKDGEFEGSARGYGGLTSLVVTVEQGYITDIAVTREYDDSPYFELASGELIPQIISEQSYALDAVASATFSSRGIMNAVNNALVDGGVVEGEKVGSKASNRTGAHTTSELKARASSQTEEEKAWYEVSLEDIMGSSEGTQSSPSSKESSGASNNAGFAGGK